MARHAYPRHRQHAFLLLLPRATLGKITFLATVSVLFTSINIIDMSWQVFRNGSAALAISLPFSCILGLLASMTSSTAGTNRYITLRSLKLASKKIPDLSYACSKRTICLGLCIDSVCTSGSLRPSLLLNCKLEIPYIV